MTEDCDFLLESLFYPGDEVNLELVTADNLARNYETRVIDLEKEYLVLQSPSDQGEYIQIGEGWELTIRRKKDEGQKAYVTSVFVIEYQPGKVPLLVCCKPKLLERSSSRRHSRYEVELGCVCISNGITASGRVTDISLGGCRLDIDYVSNDHETGTLEPVHFFKPGLYLHTVIDIQDQPELEFKGRAARVISNGETDKISLGLEICDIEEDKKEVLKNFLFQCQLMY